MNTIPIKNKRLDGRTILIVEDDPYISRLYEKWIKLFGADIITAADGAIGLQKLQEHTVDLILLDLGMPGMNGYEMLRELRNEPRTRTTPVIILSNTTITKGDEGFDELRAVGVTDILRKYETPLHDLIACVDTYFSEGEEIHFKNHVTEHP